MGPAWYLVPMHAALLFTCFTNGVCAVPQRTPEMDLHPHRMHPVSRCVLRTRVRPVTSSDDPVGYRPSSRPTDHLVYDNTTVAHIVVRRRYVCVTAYGTGQVVVRF